METARRWPISVCMIAGAEAHRIGRALESVVGWTAEIIVVVNEDVDDGTDRVAEQFGARVFREPWKGYVAQKNSAAEKATQPWILGLDADEVVSESLRDEIIRVISDPRLSERFAAFSFPRCTWFCGRWIRHGDWYPDRQTRLWRRGMAKWGGIDPHDKLVVNGRVGRLRGDLLHFTALDLNHQIVKYLKYAEIFAQQRVQTRKPASQFDLFVRPIWRFLRSYLFRLGFLDGWQGLLVAQITAFGTFIRYAKVCEEFERARAGK